MTDEQRLGLPEEPECCNARQPSVDSIREIFRRRAWGAAWREKALELERERDELRAKIDQVHHLVDSAKSSLSSHHLDDYTYILQQIWAVLGSRQRTGAISALASPQTSPAASSPDQAQDPSDPCK